MSAHDNEALRRWLWEAYELGQYMEGIGYQVERGMHLDVARELLSRRYGGVRAVPVGYVPDGCVGRFSGRPAV